MQNQPENTSQGTSGNTILNESPVIRINDHLNQRPNIAVFAQNLIHSIQARIQALNPEIREFGKALGFILMGVANIVNIQELAKKNKSTREKVNAILLATLVTTTNLAVATAILMKVRRNRQLNNHPDANDGNTFAASDDLRREQERFNDQDLETPENTNIEDVELPAISAYAIVNDNNTELTLNSLAIIPQQINRSSSLNSMLNRNGQNAPIENLDRSRNRSLSI